MFLLFRSLAKAVLAPWDGPAFAMLRCHSALLEHESGLWGHWKAGTEEVTAKNQSASGPAPASKPTCVPAPGLAWCACGVLLLAGELCGPEECQKARTQLPAWGRATVAWSALGLTCVQTGSWMFPVLCTGQLCHLREFLVQMLLISAAELHGRKRSLKTAHVCRRESLKGGKKELVWGFAWTLRQGSFTCYSPQAWLVLCWLPLLCPHPRLLRGFQFANKACVMLGAAVLSTAIHGAVRSSQF